MRLQNREKVLAARLIALAALTFLAVGSVAPSSVAAAGGDEVHVDFGVAIRAGANNAAFSSDGALAFAAAYGYPDPSNRIFSFDTRTGAVVDTAALSGVNPRQIVYCERNGYVAIRHDGPDPMFPQASVDVLITNTGIKQGPGSGTGLPPGFFNLRYTFPIWDPFTFGNPGKPKLAVDALDDLAFSSDGELLFYSNCGQMFCANTQTAVLADLAQINSFIDFAGGDQITMFSYTPALVVDVRGNRVPELAANGREVGYLSVGVSHNVVVQDDPSTPDVNEYRLSPSARILNFKVWPAGDKPSDDGSTGNVAGIRFLSQVVLANDGVSEGSNVLIDPTGRYGICVGVDTGNVYTFRLDTGAIRRTTPLSGFAARPNDPSSRGPRRMTVSPSTGVVVISRPGNISRPTNVNISRPTNVNISRPTNANEVASVVLAQISDRGRSPFLVRFGISLPERRSQCRVRCGRQDRVFCNLPRSARISVDPANHGDDGGQRWSQRILARAHAGQRLAVLNGMEIDEAGTLVDDGGVTLSVVGGASKTGKPPGVGSPTILPPEPGHISRPYGSCLAGDQRNTVGVPIRWGYPGMLALV